MMRDFRVALRALRRRPLFTAVTISTLSLGIGATTAVYSFVDGVLLSPLPYPQPERLMTVQVVIPEWERETVPSPRAVDALVAGMRNELPRGCRSVRGPDDRRRCRRNAGSARRMARHAVLTFGLWQRRYGGDPSVLTAVAARYLVPAVRAVGIPVWELLKSE